MAEQWHGAFRVIEESGELNRLLGKLGARPKGGHPDGKGPIGPRLEEEISDLCAAIEYFVEQNNLDVVRIWGGYTNKTQKIP